jgi:hypothetical protein
MTKEDTMRLMRRIPLVAIGGGVIVMLTAGPAAAHECFVANRSAAGNAAVAAHSAAWAEVSLEQILIEGIQVSPETADCVVANASQYGIPTSFVFGAKQAVGQGGVIAEHNPNMQAKRLAANGKGIDHAEEVYGEAVFRAIGDCSG